MVPADVSLKQIVEAAFSETHSGRSPDDVVIDEELNQRFIRTCRFYLPEADAYVLNWTLMDLRKGGDLGPVTTVRRRVEYSSSLHAAEIAAK
jgi:hypothetical protein